jgi:hypothetical protein
MTKMGTQVAEGTGAPVAQQPVVRRPRAGDWVIAGVLLALFVTAFLLAQDWPFRAALFPMIISVLGALLALVKLLGLAVATVRSRRGPSGAAVVPSERAADLPAQPMDSSPEAVNIRTAAVAAEDRRERGEVTGTPADLQVVDDDQEDDESLEYIFATAGGRAWLASLAWITAFFASFFVLGAYLTVPLFALFYLRFAGKAKWWAAAAYAAVAGAVIYVVFRTVVFIPLPVSVFPFLQF